MRYNVHMKKVLCSVFGPLFIGIVTGVSAMYLGAYALNAGNISGIEIFMSYLQNPWTVLMNLLIPVLLAYFFYFIFSRLWVSSLLCSIVVIGIATVNYYKIMLRSDPLLMSDVRLIRTGFDAASRYHLQFTRELKMTLAACILMTLFFIVFKAKEKLKIAPRLIVALVFALAAGMSVQYLYFSPKMDIKTKTSLPIDEWYPLHVYVSKGCIYPFIKSGHNMNSYKPEDYDKKAAEEYISGYEDSDIPDDEKVNIIVVQLEAFSDFSEFGMLEKIPSVQKHYKEWHKLYNESVCGHIVANVRGGGTTTTEWNFLTGYSQFNDFRGNTESYIRYLNRQGYTSHFFHPGNNWYYYRTDVNNYLGFDKSVFSEGGFEKDVNAFDAMFNSDSILVDYILNDFNAAEGPLFSFSVSYQGHGPYDSGSSERSFITSESGLSDASCNILNNYLELQEDTINQMLRLKNELAASTKPAILLLYGDHKPWAGDSDSVYKELGEDPSKADEATLMSMYSTPYIIWANKAAKEKLGKDFKGEINAESPCFLMSELFDICGWEGSAFMKVSRQMKNITPLLHLNGMMFYDNNLTFKLPEEQNTILRKYLWTQYYLQTNF